ncbi:hypothetical protein HDV00_004500 [Rhizophlyctis rosea]|nr:hypothetical protein HDV00_004500 [Rhizophlyctis rosea]
MSTSETVAKLLWEATGGDPTELEALHVETSGSERILPSIFPVDELAAGAVGALTLAAGWFLQERNASAPEQPPSDQPLAKIDTCSAVASFCSERFLSINDSQLRDVWAPVSGDYPTQDGYIRIHANFPHHSAAALKALHLPLDTTDKSVIASATSKFPAAVLEAEIEATGGCAGQLRSLADWKAHPQYQALSQLPPIELTPLTTAASNSSSPLPQLAPATRPLSKIRVLDLTRVLAGPVCGRLLAAHGADVLHISSKALPSLPSLDPDTLIGKRTANIDLTTPFGRETLTTLIKDANIFVQSYRPGSLAQKGFSPEEVARINPNIVYVSISAYGRTGPFANRKGFDSLVQMTTGIAHEQSLHTSTPGKPKPLPCQALDHGTGWMAALGAVQALRRQRREGGRGWLVEVSLARTGMVLEGLGRVEGGLREGKGLEEGDVRDLVVEEDCVYGRMRHVKMVGEVRGGVVGWRWGPHVLGSDEATWDGFE